jgi:hypothetical protein
MIEWQKHYHTDSARETRLHPCTPCSSNIAGKVDNTIWKTLRSHCRISVDFDKIYVYCDKYCVYSDKCIFIIIKIKYVNSDNINDIYDKLNFIINYTYFITTNTNFIY